MPNGVLFRFMLHPQLEIGKLCSDPVGQIQPSCAVLHTGSDGHFYGSGMPGVATMPAMRRIS
jgi:hypothetical protein